MDVMDATPLTSDTDSTSGSSDSDSDSDSTTTEVGWCAVQVDVVDYFNGSYIHLQLVVKVHVSDSDIFSTTKFLGPSTVQDYVPYQQENVVTMWLGHDMMKVLSVWHCTPCTCPHWIC